MVETGGDIPEGTSAPPILPRRAPGDNCPRRPAMRSAIPAPGSLGGVIFDTSEATFDQDVIERSRELPVVVDFWAAWCGPCRALTPALETAAGKRQGNVELVKVDVDANQELAARYGVQGIPAVKAFKDGEVADEFVGAVPQAEVERFFDRI